MHQTRRIRLGNPNKSYAQFRLCRQAATGVTMSSLARGSLYNAYDGKFDQLYVQVSTSAHYGVSVRERQERFLTSVNRLVFPTR